MCRELRSEKELLSILQQHSLTSNASNQIKLPEIHVSGRAVGQIASFSCAPGFRLRGERQVICLNSGTWSHFPPYCEQITCDALPAPLNGYARPAQEMTWPFLNIKKQTELISESKGLTNRQFEIGEAIQFSCAERYIMNGSAISICHQNGQWSAPVPSCKFISNHDVPELILILFFFTLMLYWFIRL